MTRRETRIFTTGWLVGLIVQSIFYLITASIFPNNNSTSPDNNPGSVGNIPQFNSSQSVPLK